MQARSELIELRHFRYFVALAEDLHFGRAASRLNIVQPALTAQIKALESLLGVSLFERTKRRVELTEAGTQFLVQAYAVFAQVSEAVQRAKDTARGVTGTLRIGYGASAAIGGVIAPAINRFQNAWPNVGITLKEMASSEVLAQLQIGDLDLGYASVQDGFEEFGLCARGVGQWPWVLAVSTSHHLSGQKAVRLNSLSTEKIAVYADHGRHLSVSNILEKIPDVAVESAFESSNITSLITYVASGLGVAFVPAPIAQLGFPGVKYLALDDIVEDMRMNLIWTADCSRPVVKNFLETV